MIELIKKISNNVMKLSRQLVLLVLLGLNSNRIIANDSTTVWKKVCDDFKECKLVFKDSLKDNRNKWPLVNDEKAGLAEFLPDGGLHLKTTSQIDLAQWVKLDIKKEDNFDVEADVEFKKGTSNAMYGIIWGVKDWDNYQYFTINQNGYYTYGVKFEGLNIQSSGELYSSDILRGKEKINKIKVKRVEKKIFLTMNGEIIESYNYNPISGKRFGVIVMNSKADCIVRNFIVQKDDNAAGNYATDKADESFKGNGSGFIISNKGYIVTNNHVIENAETIIVEMNDDKGKKSYKAEVVQKDANSDLAILKISDAEYTVSSNPIPFSISNSSIDVGTQVFTLGFPMALTAMGKEVKFTDGKISAKTGFKGDIGSYQTSVPVQPGNSGGPLFDNDGVLVGVINAKISEADNVSYAIKVNALKNIIDLLSDTISFPQTNELKAMTTEQKIKQLVKITVLVKTK